MPQVELRLDGRLLKVADGWYSEAALAVEFDGRVKYRRPRFGRTPEEELWHEKRTEDALRSLGVRFIRVAAEDLGDGRRRKLATQVLRALQSAGPRERRFQEVARAAGRVRDETPDEDGWLHRTDDRVGMMSRLA